MPILFIAVQCVQCSTMQVKQQKKSNNNWVCVVCNQRQSIIRIHARGHVARELRNFVQEFNLSRMKKESGDCEFFRPTSDGYHFATSHADEPVIPAKRRTDWSEYLDPEEQDPCAYNGEDFDSGTLYTPEFTTDLSTKKPNHTSTERRAVDHMIKPLEKFSRTAIVEGIGYKAQCGTVEKKSSSRWSEYLNNEEEDDEKFSGDDPSELQLLEDCSRVEDEVHPDFI